MEQVTIAYTVKGSGRPLILLHGNSEDHTIFKEAADVLANYFTVYTPDSRCHGQSTDTEMMSQTAADFSSETVEDKEMTCLSSTKRKELLTLNPMPHKNILWE